MAAKKAPQKKAAPKNDVPKIRARIDQLVDYEGSKIKAFASVTIGGHFAVHGFKVYEAEDGKLSVFCPGSKSQTDGKYYDDAHPITAEGRAALTSSILKAYEQQLDQDEAQIEDQDESADEVQTM